MFFVIKEILQIVWKDVQISGVYDLFPDLGRGLQDLVVKDHLHVRILFLSGYGSCVLGVGFLQLFYAGSQEVIGARELHGRIDLHLLKVLQRALALAVEASDGIHFIPKKLYSHRIRHLRSEDVQDASP